MSVTIVPNTGDARMTHTIHPNDNQNIDYIDALCAILDARGILKHSDAEAIKKSFVERSEVTFEDFLLEEGMVSKEDLLAALGELHQTPYLDVIGEFFDHALVTMFPRDVLLRNMIIPYQRDGDILIVIAAYPRDPQLPEIIGQFVSYDVTFMVGIARDICDMAKEFYDSSLTVPESDLVDIENKETEHEAHDLIDHDTSNTHEQS